ncbi:hypothetical protein ACIQ9R_36190 [Streptomyces sp. NPDC094447]|uniref:hypothetical protein n=1 Tax=Streptomyces sp. NPDC094447 TaxID=3366062 RepID=UPI0037F54569
MSVILAKFPDHTPDRVSDDDAPAVLFVPTPDEYVDVPDELFIVVRSKPDGRTTSVEVIDSPPWNDSVFRENGRTTVWQTLLPEYEGEPAHAVKVLDLAHSTDYRDENGTDWSKGEEAARKFYRDSAERAFLRAVEARLTLAGFLNSYTGVVRCQDFGLTLDGSDEHWAFRHVDGTWEFATNDVTDMDGWHHKGTIAPANASPARVAAAILVQLADYGDVTLDELRPLARLRTRIGVWRLTPHWRNFKSRTSLAYVRRRNRARQVYDRYRNRVTVRIDRDS